MIEETTTLDATEVSVQKMRAPLADPNFVIADNDPTDPVIIISDDPGAVDDVLA